MPELSTSLHVPYTPSRSCHLSHPWTMLILETLLICVSRIRELLLGDTIEFMTESLHTRAFHSFSSKESIH
eukprot:3313341-Pleurochrysis_carterae.AAC.1